MFKSTPTQFQTTIFASTDMNNVGDNVRDNVGEQISSKLTERQRNILNIIKESPTISGRQMSEMLSVSQRTIERDLSFLQNHGILKHEGSDKDGAWVITRNIPLID
jgi:ATP-dependent DNA helicase RecG